LYRGGPISYAEVEPSGPTIVAGSVPNRLKEVGGTGGSNFACNYGFQQKFFEFGALPGVDDPFFNGGLAIESKNPESYYLVAGSNDEEPVGSDTRSIESPGQNTLDQAGGTTTTGNTNPFKHFPVISSANPDVEADRDPFEVWKEVHLE